MILKFPYVQNWAHRFGVNVLHPLSLQNSLQQQWKAGCCLTTPVRFRCGYELDVDQSKRNSQGLNLGEEAEPVFQPRRAVILTKMTRYEYERKICDGMSDVEFREYVSREISYVVVICG